MRCVLWKKGCKGTSKLNLETDLIYPNSIHNHDIESYQSEVFDLKNRCKKVARSSQGSLRKLFDDVTRTDPSACQISFNECESSMYRSRRKTEPKIPLNAGEFSEMLPGTTYAQHHKFTISLATQIAVIFYSEPMMNLLSEITDIQFDGTFYTVPVQFYQLWTIFVVVDRYTLPAIHCLMTSKSQELYATILDRIFSNLPNFKPTTVISDWESAPRNAFKTITPNINITGCWFHYTQRIWAKVQKLGLAESFRENNGISQFVRKLMAIPFLPASLISPTFLLIQLPDLPPTESMKLEKLVKYFKSVGCAR